MPSIFTKIVLAMFYTDALVWIHVVGVTLIHMALRDIYPADKRVRRTLRKQRCLYPWYRFLCGTWFTVSMVCVGCSTAAQIQLLTSILGGSTIALAFGLWFHHEVIKTKWIGANFPRQVLIAIAMMRAKKA